ncbi:MAG: peptidylprolyl isomerase [Methanomicrobiales archaeon]|nr:peptidylprolyl isomerase [Methanomicrobiales archaeon]
MTVAEGDFIRLSYTGKADDRTFDTTDEETAKEAGIHNPSAVYGPVMIRVGSRHVVIGLDDAVIGKEAGESGEVEVPPEKAFGPHDETRMESVSIAKFPEKPRLGMQVELENREGTVANIIGRRAIVDFNHPLAGKTITYSYKVERVAETTEEKIQGLIHLYTQREMEVKEEGSTITIFLPPAIIYDRRWLLWRSRVVQEIFEYFPEVQDIVLQETFHRPEKKEAEGKEE